MGYQRDLETTVHMRLYALKKRHVLFFLILLSIIMFFAVVIGALGPPVLSRNSHYATENLPPGRNLYNGFYKITSDPVLLFQKEIWFSAVIHREKSDGIMSIPLTVNISILCRTYPEKVKDGDESKPDAGDVIDIEKFQKNITLVCTDGKPCNEMQLIHIGHLRCAAYTFKVRFLGLLAQREDSDAANIRKRRAVQPRTLRSGRRSRKLLPVLVEAEDAASDNDIEDESSIEDTGVDIDDAQIADNEDDKRPSEGKTRRNKEDTNYVKISVGDETPHAQFGPVMEEENKETNNPVIPNFVIKEIEFITQTRNPTFGYFEMFSRAVAFVGAFCLMCLFISSLKAFGWQHWTLEQKWTSVILFLHILYYDPFHPLMYLLPGWIPGALDSFFAISFYAFLLLFWISAFGSLRAAASTCLCFCTPRFLFSTAIWLFLISFNGWFLHSEYADPLFSITQHPNALKVFLALGGVLAFLYLLYFFIQLFRSYSELKAMPYYGLRLTLLLVPILFSTTNFLVILAVRFTPTGSIFFLRAPTTDLINPNGTLGDQRPFTSSCAAFPTFRSALELSLSFGIAFSFCLLMTISYSPSKTALAEANYRDDPSVSLAYESDEDVLYGSDHDDILLRRTVRNR